MPYVMNQVGLELNDEDYKDWQMMSPSKRTEIVSVALKDRRKRQDEYFNSLEYKAKVRELRAEEDRINELEARAKQQIVGLHCGIGGCKNTTWVPVSEEIAAAKRRTQGGPGWVCDEHAMEGISTDPRDYQT